MSVEEAHKSLVIDLKGIKIAVINTGLQLLKNEKQAWSPFYTALNSMLTSKLWLGVQVLASIAFYLIP